MRAPILAVRLHEYRSNLSYSIFEGVTVTFFLSRSATYGYDQRCEIFGTRGLVSVANIPQHHAIISDSTGIHASRLQHSFPERFHVAFGLELEAFCDTLLHGVRWPVTAQQCIRVQRIADAAASSCKFGEVVSL